jgi:hypothetical protein
MLLLKSKDPLGVNILETQQLDYPTDSSMVVDSTKRMFQRTFIMPSNMIHYFNHSRKGESIDGAHLNSRFDRTKYSAAIKR